MTMELGRVNTGTVYENTRETKKTQDTAAKTTFSQQVMTCTGCGTQKTMLCSDALFSMASFVTGESVNVYKAEDYSEDNPVYLVKGLDSKGNEYEQTINANEVNPNSCTYLELSVLNVHAGKKGVDSFFQMSIAHDKGGSKSFFDNVNYNEAVQQSLKDYKTMKAWDSYLKCNNWWQEIMDYFLTK